MSYTYSDGVTEPAIGDHARNASVDGYVTFIGAPPGRPTPPPGEATIHLAVLLPLTSPPTNGVVIYQEDSAFVVANITDFSLNLTKVS